MTHTICEAQLPSRLYLRLYEAEALIESGYHTALILSKFMHNVRIIKVLEIAIEKTRLGRLRLVEMCDDRCIHQGILRS